MKRGRRRVNKTQPKFIELEKVLSSKIDLRLSTGGVTNNYQNAAQTPSGFTTILNTNKSVG